jgi:hypothetical protein
LTGTSYTLTSLDDSLQFYHSKEQQEVHNRTNITRQNKQQTLQTYFPLFPSLSGGDFHCSQDM